MAEGFSQSRSDDSDTSDTYVEMIFERPPAPSAPSSPVKAEPPHTPKPRDFSEFFERQESARKSQLDARKEKEPQFTFKPESFTTSSLPKSPSQKATTSAPQPKKSPQNHPVACDMTTRVQEIYQESLRANQPPEPKPKEFKMRHPSGTTSQIARDRTAIMIDGLIGPDQQLSQSKLRVLLHRFAILEPSLVKKVEDQVRISDDCFDAERLKALFVGAVNETDKSKLARRIKPSVVAGLSNNRKAFVCPRAKAPRPPVEEPRRRPPPEEPRPLAPSVSSESYDAAETAAREEPYQFTRKKATPKKAKPVGAKYFPGFYDNIDFYANNPKTMPRK